MTHQNKTTKLEDYSVLDAYKGINPAISDTATYFFPTAEKMAATFAGENDDDCFLYSRHLSPSTNYLAQALATMEGAEDAQVTASGMSAISCAIMQICNFGDEIISARTIYGGTHALMKNFLPRFGIKTNFVDITDLKSIKSKITSNTKLIYCETVSNPLLEVCDLVALSKICKEAGLLLVVDNTFTPLIIHPIKYGADIVIYSLTKYINGASDCVGGAICSNKKFINSLKDVHNGAGMLLGPVMDSFRAASILKNLRTLSIRMQKHSQNARYLAENIEKLGIKVFYPGLLSHPQHRLFESMADLGYGHSGIITFDAKDQKIAEKLLVEMQNELVGYLAVSLGSYKTLFSLPSSSTSSEIPTEDQESTGITNGLVRMSVGLDHDIKNTFERIKKCLKHVKLI
ncbi:MAG: aminotransferase class I/II-fold pyridoxal phosphate-dependent enzyme [bacterium]